MKQKSVFSTYQKWVIGLLALLQFTLVLDFMVLSPLGAILMPQLKISSADFGLVVSAYAFSAGISGFITAGFADKFPRKSMLLFFYTGFIIGTCLCALSNSFTSLLIARVITGIFGGVIGSISFAIITDIFAMEVRGRVMGFVQMAFAGSQVLGLPLGMYLAAKFNWHAPFWFVVALALLIWVFVFVKIEHTKPLQQSPTDAKAYKHLFKVFSKKQYLLAFSATILLATGGFMIMPFSSAFAVENMGISLDDLPLVFFVTGICTMISGPFMGKLSDKYGKFKIFLIGTTITLIMIPVYTQRGITPVYVLMIINAILFVGITSRVIPVQAMMTGIPEPKDRGAFMSITASLQQLAGGVASSVAGMIVVKTASGRLEKFDVLGYVVMASMLLTVLLMYLVNRYIIKPN